MRYAIMNLALVGVLALPRPAAALDGNELLDRCTHEDEAVELWCMGYASGWHGRNAIRAKGDSNPICFPEARASQFKDVLVKYLKNHPETRHQHAVLLTFKAFKEAFPCPKN